MTRVLALMLLSLAACSDGTTAEQRGEALFHDPAMSPSTANAVTCATCHRTSDAPDTRILAGGSLLGVSNRETYFGGRERDLRAAVNYCLRRFMRHPSREPLSASDARGLDLLSYLDTLEGPNDSVPWSLSLVDGNLPAGDAVRGAEIYDNGCRYCHGDTTTGTGRLTPFIAAIPTDTIEEHEEFARIISVQKVRAGAFYGLGGDMAPFSPEVLDDQALADVIEYIFQGYDAYAVPAP